MCELAGQGLVLLPGQPFERGLVALDLLVPCTREQGCNEATGRTSLRPFRYPAWSRGGKPPQNRQAAPDSLARFLARSSSILMLSNACAIASRGGRESRNTLSVPPPHRVREQRTHDVCSRLIAGQGLAR